MSSKWKLNIDDAEKHFIHYHFILHIKTENMNLVFIYLPVGTEIEVDVLSEGVVLK